MARLNPFVFDNRDPWPTEIPGHFSEQFRYILKRAHEILDGRRTPEQIRYVYDTILWLNEEQEKRAAAEGPPSDGSPHIIARSPAYDLLHALDWVEIKEQDFLPNATWRDYFAVQALALIHDAVLLVSDPQNYAQYEDRSEAKLMRLWHAAEKAIEATEVITMPDMLEREKYVADEKAAQKVSLQASSGGIAKNKESRALNVRVIRSYKELLIKTVGISNREAARIIAKQTPEADLKKAEILVENAQHRFEIWIGEHKSEEKNRKASLFDRIIIPT